jgi:hypothetical protein
VEEAGAEKGGRRAGSSREIEVKTKQNGKSPKLTRLPSLAVCTLYLEGINKS